MKTTEAIRALQEGRQTSEEAVGAALARIEATRDLNAYISVFSKGALERARALDAARRRGDPAGPLAGMPVAVKDNLVMKTGTTTCASKILSQFRSPYDATVVERIEAAGGVVVGKTNMDEFAMGTSTENSWFGRAKNPLAPDRIAGGSSGGSAVAVASGTVALALGSDTGGSIRQPAACCGVVGVKPTYGRVSRYGLVAYASSLDQVGTFAPDVEGAALLLNVIAGHDPRDQTSSLATAPDFTARLQGGVKGKVVGVPAEYFGEGLAPRMKAAVETCLAHLEGEGAMLRPVHMPMTAHGVAAYYVLATAEASSNLSRYDGVRYTLRPENVKDLRQLYVQSRAEGFGWEVKKRIMLGTYVLSSGFYDAYYMQAQKVRRLITADFDRAFADCDVVATPVMPTFPVLAGEFLADPMAGYLADVYTVGVNLAGLPAVSVPLEKVDGLPASIQFIGKSFREDELFQVAAAAERLVS